MSKRFPPKIRVGHGLKLNEPVRVKWGLLISGFMDTNNCF